MSENASEVFIHGVASGDPLQDRVIIWTRVTTATNEPVQVNWKMGRDRNFNDLVASGTALAQSDADFTVKVDVTGLKPGTHYFYQFAALGQTSTVGRTKTLPQNGTKHIRFAQVSCARYDAGFFNAYARIAERDDLDFVLHLGDYIYEIAEKLPANQIVGDRLFEPLHECKTLADYRCRYAQYRRDPAVQKMHAALPMIATMDDHELANDAWRDGAGEHNPEVDGDWAIRRATAFRVRWEWQPARMPDPADPERVFRKVSLGGLADLLLVETRSRRDLPVVGEAMYKPDRSALGQQQREWLFSELENSTATWRVLGCPSVLSPTWSPTLPESLKKPLVKVKLIDADTFGPDSDQWDGYPVERDRLLGLIQEKAIKNFVVLSGDVHVGLAMELKRHAFDPDEAPIGVEFVTTSVASFNLDDKMGWEPRTKSKPIQAELVKAIPHIKWCDLDSHGYNIIDVTPAQVTAEWRFVDTVLQPSDKEMLGATFMVKAGSPLSLAPSPPLASQIPTPALNTPNPPANVSQVEQSSQPTATQNRLQVLVFQPLSLGIAVGSGALKPQGRFTIEAWVYPATDAGKQVIFADGETRFYLEGGELKFQATPTTEAIAPSATPCVIASSGAGLVAGNWYHVAVVRAGSRPGDTKLYINGVHNDNKTAISPVLSFGNTYLGGHPDAPDSSFQGKLLEVRVWRYARSLCEIEANRLYPLTGRELGLMRYWSLTQTVGSILHDKTTNRAVGTVSQDAVWEEVEIPLKLKLDPQERLTRSTGLEDYGYWFKEMAKQQKTEADSPFLRGRIWA